MIESSGSTNFILPPANKMVMAVTDFLNYRLNTARGRTVLHVPLSSLTADGVDVTRHQAAATLTTEGLDGVGAIAMGTADNTFTDTRKVVLSLTSPITLLYATTIRNH
jgi:hypothetical protein